MTPNYFNLRRDVYNTYPNVKIVIACGKRGCGKTYNFIDEILENFLNTEKGFVYVGRYVEELKSKYIGDLFDDVKDKYLPLFKTKYDLENPNIVFWKSDYWLVDETEKKNEYIIKIGTATCIHNAEKFKRTKAHTWINRVLFDEFITRKGYINGDKEPVEFEKIVGTLARQSNSDLRIYLAGNPDYDPSMVPYLKPYRIDYDSLPYNTVITFDTKDAQTGEIIKNNVCFVKLASPEDSDGVKDKYLNSSVIGVFSTAETRMAVTGEVYHDTYNVIVLNEWIENNDFKPVFTLKQETVLKVDNVHPRHIYCTVGVVNQVPVILIHGHDHFKDCHHIIGRYEYLSQPIDDSVYRGNLRLYPNYSKLYNQAVYTLNVFVEAEDMAQTLFNIVKEGKDLPYICQ